jgi:hypothetical protein
VQSTLLKLLQDSRCHRNLRNVCQKHIYLPPATLSIHDGATVMEETSKAFGEIFWV